jgi:ribosomal protection tetracycline resistance protein
MDATRRIRNLGILAHVDAGKTTVTEQMLYLSGSTRAVGNVDKGTSLSDALEVEKKRGISVRASTMSFAWREVQINLIDTPGHVDFSAEVERSLRVLDCAVLVLSAVEGIQAQSEPIWDALAAMGIPTLLFINKIDRKGADVTGVFAELQRTFSPDVVLLNRADNEGFDEAGIDELSAEQTIVLIEKVAEQDDELLERYLDGKVSESQVVQAALVQAIHNRKLFPVMCGAAKSRAGIEALLDAIVCYLPDATTQVDRPVSGVVYRIDHDDRFGRIAGVRLFAGYLQTRDTVVNYTADRHEKIAQIKRSTSNKLEDVGTLAAGDIGFLCGLPDVQIGDILGEPEPVPGDYALSEPLLSVQVRPIDETEHTPLAKALQQLASEDPHLNFRWYGEERELHVKIMGAIQIEILTAILTTRFGIAAEFSDPTVIYRETPATQAYGGDSYTMPKPCWAIVNYLLEPGPRGSGIEYHTEVNVDQIKLKYQKEIEASIADALRQGIKGWEVTDLKITLVDGSDHVLHSRPGNFKLATNIALMQGLMAADTILLEPYLAYRITGPEAIVGKVTADIVEMRGSFEPAEMVAGQFVLRGRFPLATSMDYAIRLNGLAGGKAKMTLRFDGYEECPPGQGVEREYKGISPLDRSKYILLMRGAITMATT